MLLLLTGERLSVKVLREGQLVDLSYQLKQRRPLVPILHGVDCVPSYFIVGGLVFVPLSIPFLEHAYGGQSSFEHSALLLVVHVVLYVALHSFVHARLVRIYLGKLIPLKQQTYEDDCPF